MGNPPSDPAGGLRQSGEVSQPFATPLAEHQGVQSLLFFKVSAFVFVSLLAAVAVVEAGWL